MPPEARVLPESSASQSQDRLQARGAMQRWEDAIPWFLTVASTIVLGCIAYFLVENVLWFRSTALPVESSGLSTYRLHVHHLHIAMIKRSVGLFSGFALLFLGTAVVFYSMRTQHTVNLAGASLQARIGSTSPGVIAMALGVLLMLGTIASKDEFPPYSGEAPAAQGGAADHAPNDSSSAEQPPLIVVPFEPDRP